MGGGDSQTNSLSSSTASTFVFRLLGKNCRNFTYLCVSDKQSDVSFFQQNFIQKARIEYKSGNALLCKGNIITMM